MARELPCSTTRKGSAFEWQSVTTGACVNPLTIYGLLAVTAMLVCYVLEDRNPWYIMGFAVSCALGSSYGFLQGAWPFGIVEAVWAVVAVRRWRRTRK